MAHHERATAKAIDYSLKRWKALVRFIDDGDLPIDNNRVENQILPIAIGRNNWLFAGNLRAGKRVAAVMSLAHSARLNGHEPDAYCATLWRGYRQSLQAGSANCCGTAGSHNPVTNDPQDEEIEALIAEGGEIPLGALPPFEIATTAADSHNALAMLVRRYGEALNALLKRLDRAIALAWSYHVFTDEVNGP